MESINMGMILAEQHNQGVRKNWMVEVYNRYNEVVKTFKVLNSTEDHVETLCDDWNEYPYTAQYFELPTLTNQ